MALALVSGIVSFISVAVSFFIEQLFSNLLNSFAYTKKPEKNRLRSLLYNTCLYKKALLYPGFRGKKILCFAEKLLRHPVFRGKI